MDDFKSRLRNDLGGHARGMPPFEGDMSRVKRRGRNRRWASRSAGAFSALAILGGGLAITLATRDGGSLRVGTITNNPDEIAIVNPTTTPTPTPAAELPRATETAPQPTPPDIFSDSDDVRLVVATGWGTGLVANTGDLYAAVSCCQNDTEWHAQGNVEHLQGAVSVRDDLRGGLVTASANSLYWLQAGALADTGQPTLIASIEPTDETTQTRLDLWDVTDFDNAVTVLFSTSSISTDGSSGKATLYKFRLALDSSPEQLEGTDWSDNASDGAYTWVSGAWLPEGGHMSLKSSSTGTDSSCEWIEFIEFDEAEDGLYESPYPPPIDSSTCPHLSMAAATINDDGLLAISTRYRSAAPELEIWDVAGNQQATFALPATDEGDGYWSEIDIVDNQVLISRGVGMDTARWAEQDETYLIDVSKPDSEPRATAYWGAPAFVRSDISTDALSPLHVEDPKWFLRSGTVSEPAPQPTLVPDDADLTAEPPDQRPAGHDGCLGEICLGDPLDHALRVAVALYGDADNDSADARREGEARPANQHVFLIDDYDIRITSTDNTVASIRIDPRFEVVETSPVQDEPLNVADILATMGEPTEVFNGVGEGQQVLWLTYRTAAGLISYGFVEFFGGGGQLNEEGDVSIPTSYYGLSINAYWARVEV